MNIKQSITKPITEELELFGKMFDDTLKSSNVTLHNVFSHMLQSKGKMMRPTLLMLLAKGLGCLNDKSYHSAISLELLHTASLIHDDVVDESSERRGLASINKIFGNKIAVLSGDYILSNALLHASLTESPKIVESISNLGKALSEGELLQLYNSQSINFSEDTYIEIISKKTASLFVTCCECAAISANAGKEITDKCKDFGLNLGIAFQIKDDIFDYFESEKIGKPTGNDMKECKLTLPALYAINNFGNEHIIDIANRIKQGSAADSEIQEMIDFTKEKGGIDYAEKTIGKYIAKAHAFTENIKDQDIHNSLDLYIDYIYRRNH